MSAADGAHLTLAYRQLLNAAGVGYTVEVSDDLATWDGSGAQVEAVGTAQPTGDGRTVLVQWRLKSPVSALPGGRKFLRLRVDAMP